MAGLSAKAARRRASDRNKKMALDFKLSGSGKPYSKARVKWKREQRKALDNGATVRYGLVRFKEAPREDVPGYTWKGRGLT